MVKKILRNFVIEATALYLASQAAQGLFFEKGFQSLVITGFVLAAASFLIRPVLNILLLPINMVTFNFFRWANHTITLFLVDLALKQFSIMQFNYPGFKSEYFDLPPLFFEQGVAAYLAFSILISIIAGTIYWLIDKH
jgi:uncharacterized membrane protein YvlD (DUF360 family)